MCFRRARKYCKDRAPGRSFRSLRGVVNGGESEGEMLSPPKTSAPDASPLRPDGENPSEKTRHARSREKGAAGNTGSRRPPEGDTPLAEASSDPGATFPDRNGGSLSEKTSSPDMRREADGTGGREPKANRPPGARSRRRPIPPIPRVGFGCGGFAPRLFPLPTSPTAGTSHTKYARIYPFNFFSRIFLRKAC